VGGVTSGSDRVEAPRFLAEHWEKFRASGAVPATPRLAATVILLRPGDDGFEVYVQRRAATMAFAPGMYAFPGGSVDRAADYPQIPNQSGDPVRVAWTSRMGLPLDDAQAVVRAAVRELAEEAGVAVEPATLAPWARWLTPEFEPRRFDTFFFLARLPDGQGARETGGEADRVAWLAPAQAVRLPMLPPTRHTLAELARFATIDEVFAAAETRDVSEPIRPVIEVEGEATWLRLV
jgi:8-oxo-dGTP pyrophosphatase MutT (NUDIX family)